jgi:hypothetical protein
LKISINFRAVVFALIALAMLAVLLCTCAKRPRSESQLSVSPVPPREGTPIDQTTVLPERKKVILKKPLSP